MRVSYSISCHHITSHHIRYFSLCVAWARRGFLLRAAACDVHRRACVCMHAGVRAGESEVAARFASDLSHMAMV
jgi:hypothetical protein